MIDPDAVMRAAAEETRAERVRREAAEAHAVALARIIDSVRDALTGGVHEGLDDKTIGERAARVLRERDEWKARAEKAEAECREQRERADRMQQAHMDLCDERIPELTARAEKAEEERDDAVRSAKAITELKRRVDAIALYGCGKCQRGPA